MDTTREPNDGIEREEIAEPHHCRRRSKSTDSDYTPIDDAWISAQLNRDHRWRRPPWPVVCRVAEQTHQKRVQRWRSFFGLGSDSVSAGRPSRRFVLPQACGWLISAMVHATLLLALGWYVVHLDSNSLDESRYVIVDARANPSISAPPQVLEISIPSVSHLPANGPFSSPLSAPAKVNDAGALPPAIQLATFAQQDSGPVGEVQAMVGSVGVGAATRGEGQTGAEFFGVRSTGRRFVFIVDCSKSMEMGNKWREATRELMTAIQRLSEEQSFYVIFFDKSSHRMFAADDPASTLVAATMENQNRLRRWISSIRLGFYTRPASSVYFALTLRPDAIYVLSDGEFEDQTAAMLRERNAADRRDGDGRQVVVHTIGFHSTHGQKVLQRIARENGGRYVYVPDPQLADLGPRQR